ncbi:MAG: hypothetical protein JWR84_3354 [Caulobacter sp.]|nr:hypothetical protein [Caulobacter sp.]
MTRLQPLLLALVAVVLAGVAGPSVAANPRGECLWKALPANQRDEMIDNYRAKGLASIAEVKVSDELTLTLRKACSFKAEEDYAAGEIIGATLVVKGADLMLFERNKLARGTMDRVWIQLPQADRDSLTTFGLSILADGNDAAAEAAAVIVRVTQELGLPTTSLNEDVYAYLVARAIREAREAGR